MSSVHNHELSSFTYIKLQDEHNCNISWKHEHQNMRIIKGRLHCLIKYSCCTQHVQNFCYCFCLHALSLNQLGGEEAKN